MREKQNEETLTCEIFQMQIVSCVCRPVQVQSHTCQGMAQFLDIFCIMWDSKHQELSSINQAAEKLLPYFQKLSM